MPPEVACPSKLCTNQHHLSDNQKCTCGINSLDNLFLRCVGTHLCCHVNLNSLATSILVGDSAFEGNRALSLLSFPSVLGKNS